MQADRPKDGASARRPATDADPGRPWTDPDQLPTDADQLPGQLPTVAEQLDNSLIVPIGTALVEANGRILHWSAEAEELLGYTAQEAVGSSAAQLLVAESRRPQVLALFEQILHGRPWSGVFPVRHRDGHHVLLAFRTHLVSGLDGRPLVLAVVSDVSAVRRLQSDLALLNSFFTQSPIGMAVYDPQLRFVRLNEALAEVNGIPVADHLGRRVTEVLPGINGAEVEDVMRHVLETGEPVIDARSHGRTPGDLTRDHAWSASYFRLEEPPGQVLGVSSTIVDVTQRFLAEERAARATERLALLVDVTAAIGTTLDLRRTARELADAMVPRVADVSGVFVLERLVSGEQAGPGDRVRRLAVATTDSTYPLADLPPDAVYEIPPDSPYARAMSSGQTVVVPSWELPPLTDEAHVERMRAYLRNRSRSVHVTPLVARGVVLGMVVYSRRGDRESLAVEDVTLGAELATRAAVAIDNARLYTLERDAAKARQQALDEAHAAQQRLALLAEASTRIGATLDLRRTAEELVEVVIPRLADFVTVDLMESVLAGEETAPVPPSGSVTMRAVAVGEYSPGGLLTGAADPVGGLSQSARLYAESLRSGRSILVAQVNEENLARIVASPDRVQPALESGLHSYLMVPLLARGAVLGGAEFMRLRNNPQPFGPSDVALAEELAARAAVCIDNARLYRRERDTALTLQRSLLPQEVHPTLGLDIAYRYLPSSELSEVGGDWFDVIPLSCGRVALVVGDVTGHGLRAAATMGQLRTVAQTLITLDMDPARVMRRLDEAAAAVGEGQFATCVCVVFDPVDRVCTACCAGHLPPVVSGPKGTFRVLDLPTGAPLGVGGVPFETVEFTLPEHGLLVLYTDGLVERRDRDLDVGMEVLRRTVAEQHGSLEESCDAVLSTLVTGTREDDIAVIMAQARPIGADRLATLSLTGDRKMVGHARRFTRRTLASWGLSALIDHTELLTSELITNALVHAGAPTQLRLFRNRVLTVEVADADGHAPRMRRALEDDEGGRGMHLVNELAHRWGSRGTRHGKVVWFELELPAGSD
ncbi:MULTISPECIES: SpoIIE family protein phosphatase [unclassified Kitasatospora]|uniref:SpoIIE family protein phosphatase n=1 Tax=unclassified Kitasatospora TaxID=2633591 RepID=UPI0024750D82|nr:SpoIIE family protein phosphatase [Kitasatospora sp. MAP12-44]MDH6109665.1 PAS domain S-box-containing protein [Kitasatospora sp. MAP12-44]